MPVVSALVISCSRALRDSLGPGAGSHIPQSDKQTLEDLVSPDSPVMTADLSKASFPAGAMGVRAKQESALGLGEPGWHGVPGRTEKKLLSASCPGLGGEREQRIAVLDSGAFSALLSSWALVSPGARTSVSDEAYLLSSHLLPKGLQVKHLILRALKDPGWWWWWKVSCELGKNLFPLTGSH